MKKEVEMADSGYPDKRTILVVDDSPEDITLLSDLLKDLYKIRIANNGERALKAAMTGKPPDLILLDVMMPVMDGYEACRRLKSSPRTKDIPVIFLTAKAEIEDEMCGFELGAVDYITKPISPPIVLARVQTHLQLKMMRDYLQDQNAFLEDEVQRRTQEIVAAQRVTLQTAEALSEKNKEIEAAYAELKQAQAHIIQQEKMASIGQLAAGITHEINNPMSFITGNLGILQNYIDGITKTIRLQDEIINAHAPPEVIENLHAIKKKMKVDFILKDIKDLVPKSLEGADRVKRIVADLKIFSRMEEDVFTNEDINSGLDSTVNIVWNEIKYKAELVKEFGRLPLTRCNISHLNQVFMNLLVNAAHAIEKWGKVTVRTWTEGDNIYVSVTDTGSGIAKENLTRIFDPFFTTKEKGKGTGLGLSISYDIIKRHNGDITVESEIGKGTTFTVRIPVIRS